MPTNSLTAEIAGITFRFHCEGRGLECANLKLFEKSCAGSDDIVDVRVRLTEDIEPEPEAELLFSARKDASDDNEETDWDLLRIPSNGEYLIIQRSGTRQNIKRANIRFNAHEATLTISPIRDSGGAINPLAYPLFNIFLSRLLSFRKGFMIHSSAVIDSDGRGYLFTAKSGTGKSTIARIFVTEGAKLINDDMIAVRISPTGATAFAIPMPYYIQEPRKVSLSGIFIISQSSTNSTTRLGHAEAVARTLCNIIQQPYDKTATEKTLSDAIGCLASVPGFKLGFRPDAEVVTLVRTAMRTM